MEEMQTIRSLLFTPANRFDLIAKVPKMGADAVVIDLEDGTPPAEKSFARDALESTIAGFRNTGSPTAIFIRVNELSSPEFGADVAALRGLPIDGVVLPKCEGSEDIEAFEEAGGVQLRIAHRIIGIETARGVLNADRIAMTQAVTGIYFGATDLMSEIGGTISPNAEEILYARSRVVLAAKAARVAAIDRGFGDVRNVDAFLADSKRGRALGYDGRVCITPKQVDIANAVFVASPEEVAWAHSVTAAHRHAQENGLANVVYEGKSIGAAVMRRADSILRRAG